MRTREYVVRFTSPAFLGNAEQNGQWRTPPFKALLRQWWRVAYAAGKDFKVNVAEMRGEEGRVFGSATDASGNRSVVRIRLDKWTTGTLTRWESLSTVNHPEVGRPIDSGLYLGYGPVTLPRGQQQPALKNNAAIQANETATLSLAYPDDHAHLIDTALMLMDRYGSVGGRSRNGWGSVSLSPQGATPPLAGEVPFRTWREALAADWPHAIGRDDTGALVWHTNAFSDWKQLMRELADIKIKLRTQFKFPDERQPHNGPLDRHWLSYPTTNHGVKGWGNKRLPNSLRFKVRPAPENKVVGVIFHVPCLPPRDFHPDPQVIARVWQQVHRHLDQAGLQRIPA